MMEQLWLFDAAPPAVPPSTGVEDWEIVQITTTGEATQAKVEASYSGASLSESGKVLRPFHFRGATWVNTGASFYQGDAEYECYRIVPAATFAGPGPARTYHDHDFFGEHRPLLGGYHGMKATLGREHVVLIGPPIDMIATRKGKA